MINETWARVMTLVTSAKPEFLDKPGPQVSPSIRDVGPFLAPASPHLWKRRGNIEHIGVRVTRVPDNPESIAARLAAMALQRNIVSVIISTVDFPGFEQFGFRVERLPSEPLELQRAFEAEICAFWDLALVLDLDEVVHLA